VNDYYFYQLRRTISQKCHISEVIIRLTQDHFVFFSNIAVQFELKQFTNLLIQQKMIKQIFAVLIFAAILSSCGNTGKTSEEAVNVEFASLIENADSFDGKNVILTGKVVHVCEHSGKKMFIVGENPDIRLQIAADEETPKFEMALLGTEITVEGLLTKMVTPAKPEGEHNEGEMKEGEHAEGEAAEGCEETHVEGEAKPCCDSTKVDEAKTEEVKAEGCETEVAVAAQPALANFKLIYKSHIVK